MSHPSEYLTFLVQLFASDTLPLELSRMELYGWGDSKAICEKSKSVRHEGMFGIDPFFISKGELLVFFLQRICLILSKYSNYDYSIYEILFGTYNLPVQVMKILRLVDSSF